MRVSSRALGLHGLIIVQEQKGSIRVPSLVVQGLGSWGHGVLEFLDSGLYKGLGV